MFRPTRTLLVASLLAAAALTPALAVPTGDTPTLLIWDSVAAEPQGAAPGKANAGAIVHEYVDDLDKLVARVGEIKCEDLVGVVALAEKKVDGKLEEGLAAHHKTCPTPVLEVGIEDLERLKAWRDEGYDPFFPCTGGVDDPAMRIKGRLPLPDDGWATFTIAVGGSGSWFESWSMPKRGQVTGASVVPVDFAVAARAAGGCDAGPWWQFFRLCCFSQYLGCVLVSHIPFVGAGCKDCSTCAGECFDCAVDNPCHACDPCGLTPLFRQVVPGAN